MLHQRQRLRISNYIAQRIRTLPNVVPSLWCRAVLIVVINVSLSPVGP